MGRRRNRGIENPHQAPRMDKREFMGESKIERGLSEFRMYRIAPNDKLLNVQPSESVWAGSDVDTPTDKILSRSLHFTTQKNMAQEYAHHDRPVLMEQRGKDFLEDLQKLDDQGVEVLLITHDDLVPYHKIKRGEIDYEEAENFIQHRRHKPSELSLRQLRQAAELVVLMPEDFHVLPLRQKTVKKTKVRSLRDFPATRGSKSSKGAKPGKRDSERRKVVRGPGKFHRKMEQVRYKEDKAIKRLRNEERRLEQERSNLMIELQSRPDIYHGKNWERKSRERQKWEEEQRRKKRRIREIDGELRTVRWHRAQRREKRGYLNWDD